MSAYRADYNYIRQGTFVTSTAFTAEEDAHLIQRWNEGASASVIGAELGRSKNSVIGRVHRLCLPQRIASKTLYGAAALAAAKTRTERKPVAPLVSLAPLACLAAPPRQPRQPPAPPQKAPEPPKPKRRPSACQWPLGEPGSKGFRLCGDPAADGYPYCAIHCRVAYHNWPIRQTRHSLGVEEG